jgi:hypothetical protein
VVLLKSRCKNRRRRSILNDLDNAIDLLESLTLADRALLTGAGGYSLVPTVQYDWYRQFSFPWRSPDRRL